MDAQTNRCGLVSRAALAVVCLLLVMPSAAAHAAEARSRNFIVTDAPSVDFANQVASEAERFRAELAMKWLGRELPSWSHPCTLRVVAGNIPAQGVTTYQRYPGHVGDFQMEVVGTPQRILDSVLPHEVTHTILASHFGRPLPRWADEGISTTVEHSSERSKHERKLREFLSTRRGIPMNRMFMMTEYPPEMLTLYAQGYSVCRFLIEQGGPREFVKFLETFHRQGSWTDSVRQHYGYESLAELQEFWLDWVANGSGDVAQYVKQGAASAVVNVAATAPSNNDPASIALAANDGWYASVRDGKASAAAGEPATYSSAQPQREQGSISDLPAGPASSWSPQPRRIYR
jgi:hypothetical protein